MIDTDPRAGIVGELHNTTPHIQRLTEMVGESAIRPAVDRYIGELLDAQLRLHRQLLEVKHG
jgi:hypothetical protein